MYETPVISQKPGDVQSIVIDATPSDRQAVYDLLINSDIFGLQDADCVDEMFRSTWSALEANPAADTYHWVTCYSDGNDASKKLLGFACFGTESLTQGTWDLFWICVDPAARGKGVGGQLMRSVMTRAQMADARLMVIYTSSTEPYLPARRLYESQGCSRVAVVEDYYRVGDHLYIYTQKLK